MSESNYPPTPPGGAAAESSPGYESDADVPSKEEWLSACDVQGLPRSVAEEEWDYLGEAGFYVHRGQRLLKRHMGYRISRAKRRWEQGGYKKPGAASLPAGQQQLDEWESELQSLRLGPEQTEEVKARCRELYRLIMKAKGRE